jgi:hypothetical protein
LVVKVNEVESTGETCTEVALKLDVPPAMGRDVIGFETVKLVA